MPKVIDWERRLQTPAAKLSGRERRVLPSETFYRNSRAVRIARKLGDWRKDVRAHINEGMDRFIENTSIQKRLNKLNVSSREILFFVMNFMVTYPGPTRKDLATRKRLNAIVKRDLDKTLLSLKRLKELYLYLYDYGLWKALEKNDHRYWDDTEDKVARLPLTRVMETLDTYNSFRGRYYIREITKELTQLKREGFPSSKPGGVEKPHWDLVRSLNSVIKKPNPSLITDILICFGVHLSSEQITRKLHAT